MEEDSQSKLKYFPVMMFAITMGFGGLTIDYKKAVEVLAFPNSLYGCRLFGVCNFWILSFETFEISTRGFG